MSSDSAYWLEISRLSNAAGAANARLVEFLESTPQPNTDSELAEYDRLVADVSSAHDAWRHYTRRK
jgi:hypothetical protein